MSINTVNMASGNMVSGDFDAREFLQALFDIAVNASIPSAVMGAHMPDPPLGKTIIVGAGKASAQMAKTFEEHCNNNPNWQSPISGLVVTQYGAREKCANIEIVEASHPVPDEDGYGAAKRILALVKGAGKDDLVVALISGGGSSLLPYPAQGMDLEDKQQLNKALLASGAPISEMNVVRKMFSRIKGGRLGLAAHPARLCSLIISDVPGDDPALVASGPTIADFSGAEEAGQIIRDYEIELSSSAKAGFASTENRPPSPDNEGFVRAFHKVIASANLSLVAAADAGEKAGCEVIVLSDAIEGEASEIGKEHGRMIVEKAAQRKGKKSLGKKPLLILSGGETSVSIGKNATVGKGGRNTEYLLALAIEISGVKNVTCMSADTDGRDGSENNAGAFCDGTTLSRMKKNNIDAITYLQNHDAWTAFYAVEDLFVTGPTGTNVNDFRAVLIGH